MSTTGAKILLAAVFAARGTSFLFSKLLMNTLSPMNILAVRFLLSFFILTILFHKKILCCNKNSLKGGLILGILYTICMIFEMFGLRLVDSGVSSLIENMAIVLVPLYVAILTHTLPKRKTVFCATLAVIGVGFLSITQSCNRNGNLGIFLIILAALTYGICILVTEAVAKNGDPITVGILQLGTMGILSFIIALSTGNFVIPHENAQWFMMIMLVLVCSCFGFTFQPVGQKYVSSETAAVFTVVNPLSSSIMGITIANEGISFAKIIGYILILFSLILYNHKSKNY